jgi:hypothetical protein
MLADQAEYRNATSKRGGFVLFFGIGEVAHNWNGFTASGLHPAGGPGLRINMSKKQRINMRINTGYGKAGHGTARLERPFSRAALLDITVPPGRQSSIR